MANVAKRSFSAGELTPEARARTDLIKYATGLTTCRNFIVQKHGGVKNRTGFEFCEEVKTADTPTRLKKFVFNDDQAYLLEFGDGYMRVIEDGSYVRTTGVAAWVTATPYLQGDLVTNGGTVFYCIADHTSGATNEPGVGAETGTYWYAQTLDIYEIPSPYEPEDLKQVLFAQSADVVTFTHRDYPIYELRREALTRWLFVTAAPEPPLASPTNLDLTGGEAGVAIYYAATAVKLVTGEEGLAATVTEVNRIPSLTSPTTLTFDAVPGATDYNVYRSTDGATYGFIGRATQVLAETTNDVWEIDTAIWGGSTPNKTWTQSSTFARIQVWNDVAQKSPTGSYRIKGQTRATVSSSGELKRRLRIYVSRAGEPLVDLGTVDLPTFTSYIGGGSSGYQNFEIEVIVPDNGFTADLKFTLYAELRRDAGGSVQHDIRFTVAGNDLIEWDAPGSLGFVDYDALPDYSIAPPLQREILATPSNYPGTVSFYQQRRVFGNSWNEPEKVWASHVGGYNTFMLSTPTKDDDSSIFSIAGTQVNEVRHLLDLGGLVIFTSNAEYHTASVIPGRVAPERKSKYGIVPHLPPLIIGNRAVFVQARGSTIFDLAIDAVEGTRSNDMSVFAAHLFADHEVESWDFQRVPVPVVWLVRDDGVLLGSTIIPEHEVLGWHRHDTSGTFLDVCVVPEGGYDSVYVLVDRVVNSVTRRYIERLIQGPQAQLGYLDSCIRMNVADAVLNGDLLPAEDLEDEVTDSVVDSGARIDAGRFEENTAANTTHATHFGDQDWTLFASTFEFSAYVEADQRSQFRINFHLSGGRQFQWDIDLVAGTIVGGALDGTTAALYTVDEASLTPNGGGYDLYFYIRPSDEYATPDTEFGQPEVARCTLYMLNAGQLVYAGGIGQGMIFDPISCKTITHVPWRLDGVTHLSGQVGISGGPTQTMLASPINTERPLRLIVNNQVPFDIAELENYDDLVIGLPYVSDLETLDVDGFETSLKTRKMLVNRVTAMVNDARSFFIGHQQPDGVDPIENLYEVFVRDKDGYNDNLDALYSEDINIDIESAWNSNGRVFFRHLDPTPLTLVAVVPEGHLPKRR